VELIDILGHNKGRDNRVNREETVTLAIKAKDLESGSGKLCTTTLVQRKNIRNNPGLTDQTAPNLLDPDNHSSGDPRTLYLIKDRTLNSIFSC
jgi:hypothetical protein